VGVYSPKRERYTLKFQAGFLVQPTDGGSGYNGIREAGSAPTIIYYGPQTELQNLWADVGGMSTAVAHGQTNPQPVRLNLTATPQGSRWHVAGTVENQSQHVLEDVLLIVGDYGIALDNIEPGQTVIDYTLQALSVDVPYSDQTIWGEFYYQLNDPEAALNDQIIRGIFWPRSYVPARVNSPVVNAPISTPDEVVLLGWQRNLSTETIVEVVGQQVDQESTNLLIIRQGF
jgi:hypothetical protein